MGLNGYQRSSGKRSGGLRSISLIESDDMLNAVYDREKSIYSQIVLKEECGLKTYEFREGEAFFSEETETVDGTIRVRHEITFSLERPDKDSANAMDEIINASANGIIAVVTTNNGVSFLVGYSEKFGTEQPLRIKNSHMTTGRQFQDITVETITLVSEDCTKALVYETGTIV